jgi:hypothetical protein
MYNYIQWQHVHFISHNDKITSVHSINNQLLIIIYKQLYLPTICSLGVYVVFDVIIVHAAIGYNCLHAAIGYNCLHAAVGYNCFIYIAMLPLVIIVFYILLN